MTDHKYVQHRLVGVLRGLGVSNVEIGERLGCSRETVRNVFNMTCPPDPIRSAQLRQLLDDTARRQLQAIAGMCAYSRSGDAAEAEACRVVLDIVYPHAERCLRAVMAEAADVAQARLDEAKAAQMGFSYPTDEELSFGWSDPPADMGGPVSPA